jgi:hypothetical protein
MKKGVRKWVTKLFVIFLNWIFLNSLETALSLIFTPPIICPEGTQIYSNPDMNNAFSSLFHSEIQCIPCSGEIKECIGVFQINLVPSYLSLFLIFGAFGVGIPLIFGCLLKKANDNDSGAGKVLTFKKDYQDRFFFWIIVEMFFKVLIFLWKSLAKSGKKWAGLMPTIFYLIWFIVLLILKPYRSTKNVIECLFEYFGLFLASFIIFFESLGVTVPFEYYIFFGILNLIFNSGNVISH